MDRVKTGKAGQEYAEKCLREKGYKLILRNWRSKLGEIDLIAKEMDTVVFIEVKALVRFSPAFQPEDHLTFWKEQKLKKLALAYLNYKNLGNVSYRIDLVAIDLDRNLALLDVRHYENIIEDA